MRTDHEQHCITKARQGRELTHADKVASIYSVDELKGYMMQLHKEARLDDDAKRAIQVRLSQFEALFCRKIE